MCGTESGESYAEVLQEGEDKAELEVPLEIFISKSAVEYRYELTYLGDVPGRYTEHAILTTSGGCNEKESESATCGVAKNGNTIVPDSQGFCCDRNACNPSHDSGIESGRRSV